MIDWNAILNEHYDLKRVGLELVKAALVRTGCTRKSAAMLGISRRKVQLMVKKHGLVVVHPNEVKE